VSSAPEQGRTTVTMVPTTGGHQLAVRSTLSDPRAPVLVLLSGMGTPARYYQPFARRLNDEGLSVILVDLRGQGDSTPKNGRAGSRHGYRELIEEDVPAVMQAVRELAPEATLLLGGHSLGGQLALLAAAHDPGDVAGVVLLAAGNVHWLGHGPIAGLRYLVAAELFTATARLWGYWPGERFGFGGTQPARVMRDWAANGRRGRYLIHRSDQDYEALLGALPLPVLAVAVEGDTLAPLGAVTRLVDKVPRAHLTRWTLPSDPARPSDPKAHFRWVKRSEAVASCIARWWAEASSSSESHSP